MSTPSKEPITKQDLIEFKQELVSEISEVIANELNDIGMNHKVYDPCIEQVDDLSLLLDQKVA